VVRYRIKKGFLNYSEASEIVVNVLSNPTMLPISIGVFGSWGTGKSTILNLIEQSYNQKMKKIIFL
jgi:ABC-type polysaccharide/polyol phosphate transport system ATPase subunit